MKLLIVSIITLFPFVAISQKKPKGTYYLQLYKVDGGNGVVTPQDTTTYNYRDSLINVNWRMLSDGIKFSLENSSNKTLKIIWDESAIINSDNSTLRIVHGDTKLINKEKEQLPTSVYKNSKIVDKLVPSEYIFFKNGKWETTSFFEGNRHFGLFGAYNPEFVGKHIRVVLPIEYGDTKIEYMFYFVTTFVDKDAFWKAQKNFF